MVALIADEKQRYSSAQNLINSYGAQRPRGRAQMD